MTEVMNLLFSQEFLIRALLVGILISLCSALLGVTLVLKRFSMIGDGLSHVGFGAMAVALSMNAAPLAFSLPVVIIFAVFLLRIRENGKIKGDTAIALISTGALAIGVMVTSMTSGMNIDIYNYMFGSILTMNDSDVLISVVLSSVVLSLFVIFYNEIFAVTFDENFAKATGTRTSFYNTLIACLTAVTIVIGMRMMGALLISSLIIFPTVTSMRICKSFKSVVASSALLSVFCFVSGLIFSVKFEAPTGASVVCVNIYFLVMFSAVKFVRDKLSGQKRKKLMNAAVAVVVVIFAAAYIFVMYGFVQLSENEEDTKLSVVTTGFAQYDFARNVGGEFAEVVMLLSPGEESHTFEPTPQDIIKINECDIFIYNGGESESWVNKILDSLDSDITVLKLIDAVELYESDHEHSHSEEDEHNHDEDSHGDEKEYDEHIWTSPKNAVILTHTICEAFIGTDPENADLYSENTKIYLEKLNALDSKLMLTVSEGSGNLIVIGDRFPMKYFVEEYNLEYASAFPGCSASVEANPVTISNLINTVKSENIPVVFKVDLSSGLVAETIAEATGTEILTLYSCHVISEADFENSETYISLMERNNEALKKALS